MSMMNELEIISFFMVLVRMSVMFAILPIVGDSAVPGTVKILLSLAISFVVFPYLVKTGSINLEDARIWGSSAGGIVGTAALEVIVGLALGFVARLSFEAISFGANLVGTYMGLASASVYDPHQESQSQIVAQFQVALATLLFLSLDAHHWMFESLFSSYKIVGLGKFSMSALFGAQWIDITGQVFRFAIQISAPIAIVVFAINVAFGVLAKALPQVNMLVLSLGVTALAGFAVMFLGLSEFQAVSGGVFQRMTDWMQSLMKVMG